MHCSANVGARGDSAILFGLSGTGKTTLSADPGRQLIGDDETAWTEGGISNLEDGCYAKLIDLDKQAEPIIAAALSMPGTIIENVPTLRRASRSRRPIRKSSTSPTSSITENTRFSYPLSCNPERRQGRARPASRRPSCCSRPMPSACCRRSRCSSRRRSCTTSCSGFTAKLAGTEVGVTEPKAAFSACFGAPFMAHKPSVYAKLLAREDGEAPGALHPAEHGLGGGAFGVGKRISIKDTRALLNAALEGKLDTARSSYDDASDLQPEDAEELPGRGREILDPRNTWADKTAYDVQATSCATCSRQELRGEGLRRARHRAGDVSHGRSAAALLEGPRALREETARRGDRRLPAKRSAIAPTGPMRCMASAMAQMHARQPRRGARAIGLRIDRARSRRLLRLHEPLDVPTSARA